MKNAETNKHDRSTATVGWYMWTPTPRQLKVGKAQKEARRHGRGRQEAACKVDRSGDLVPPRRSYILSIAECRRQKVSIQMLVGGSLL